MATPDRRLASLFTKRSTTAPAVAASVGVLDTHSPSQHGIAMFTASLVSALAAGTPELSLAVVRLRSAPSADRDRHVVHEVSNYTVEDRREAARTLNGFDVAVLQHGYGLHDREDGDHALDILEWLRVPVVLVVHTVAAEPTASQRLALQKLTDSADAVVTMSRAGYQRLHELYQVEPRKLMLIPHGACAAPEEPRVTARARRPMVLTWGLLGAGKGIEWGIDALSAANMVRPRPRYVVAGPVHTNIRARANDSYLDFLTRRAEGQGVSRLVDFEPGFVSPARLSELLREADVVLVPYDSQDQVTSGVLVEAMAARIPVVCTPFPHAVELLGDGRGGILVPHRDPAAIAAALTRILVEPKAAAAMSAHNAALADLVRWPAVAGQYRQLFNALLRRPLPARQ